MNINDKLHEAIIQNKCSQKQESEIESGITLFEIIGKVRILSNSFMHDNESVFPLIEKDETHSNPLKDIYNLYLWKDIHPF